LGPGSITDPVSTYSGVLPPLMDDPPRMRTGDPRRVRVTSTRGNAHQHLLDRLAGRLGRSSDVTTALGDAVGGSVVGTSGGCAPMVAGGAHADEDWQQARSENEVIGCPPRHATFQYTSWRGAQLTLDGELDMSKWMRYRLSCSRWPPLPGWERPKTGPGVTFPDGRNAVTVGFATAPSRTPSTGMVLRCSCPRDSASRSRGGGPPPRRDSLRRSIPAAARRTRRGRNPGAKWPGCAIIITSCGSQSQEVARRADGSWWCSGSFKTGSASATSFRRRPGWRVRITDELTEFALADDARALVDSVEPSAPRPLGDAVLSSR